MEPLTIRRKLLITSLIVVAVAFSIGFFPQYLLKRSLQSELIACRAALELSALRDQAGWVYLDTARKNYGVAGERAGRFFSQIRDLTARTRSPQLRAALEEIYARRDTIIAKLATADPAVLDDVQALYLATMEKAQP